MPTRSVFPGLALCGLLGFAGGAAAFEPQPGETPAEAFVEGYQAYQAGDLQQAADAIQYAADAGYTRAQWMLGQMYAQGVGVNRDDARAFQIFAGIADTHSSDNPNGDDAPFIADALVSLGDYFRAGIDGDGEDSSGATIPAIPKDVEQARELYWRAATYFADPDAQYNLADMFNSGDLGDPDPLQAVRWARLSAEKGNPAAQALLGFLLFEGNGVSREPVVGLAYLQIARARTNGSDPQIREMHEEAFALATETERRTAAALAEQWLSANGDQTSAAAADPVTDPALPPAAVATATQ